MWFRKKVNPIKITNSHPVRTSMNIQVARIHFYLPNDVIILPVIVDWYAPYGPIQKDHLYTIQYIFNIALNNYRVRKAWFLFKGTFYPESSIRYIEITDINKLYVKEI